ncbi:1-acyl-sn-glycerol-3-phosphate acyltransferase [Bacillus ectoiniformans]|uniref:lysophospholipid acyltransferase family protein n=1 Tax=Bacillus ectoiniformans TaxID=1494429 RepID=UPI0019591B87|nr:lysophospholipid acyltransferase family protein [Bacillus ectoiniformans]MBM7647912.1 1-acyl-sn-glycerol-3-phosphate acyltransferase [Bacillus ectoiniformans]
MIRLIYFFGFIIVTLIGTIPALRKNKKVKQAKDSDGEKFDHALPKRWARSVVGQTGSSVHIEGQHHIPDGPVLLVANHEGDFDVPALLGHIDKPFGFISKVEMKKFPLVRDWMNYLDCLYINRQDRRDAVKLLRDGASLLKSGRSLLIFPEGTRSQGGEMKPFKSGGFRMAKEARVPIVPIAIKGSSDIFEKHNRRKLSPSQIYIYVLPPVEPEMFDSLDLKEAAELVRNQIDTVLKEKNK